MGSPAVAVAPRKSPPSGRRTNKPLVEKKRRARINGCLGQLKSLILSAMQTEQSTQVSRLEKADILEMTVKYLRHMQRQQVSTAALGSEPEVAAKFSAGYTECATEVIRYMDQAKCVTSDIRSRLESHLVERLRDTVCPPSAALTPVSASGVPISGPAAFVGAKTTQQKQEIAVEKEAANVICPNDSGVSQPIPMVTVNPEPLISSTEAPALAHPQNTTAASTGAPVLSADSTEEYTRHYQTAVDLANMAAGVILPAQNSSTTGSTTTAATLPSFSSPSSASSSSSSRPRLNPDPARCKSISPAQENKKRGKPRKRYNSAECAMLQPLGNSNNTNYNNTVGSGTNSAFTNTNLMDASERPQPVNAHGQSPVRAQENSNNHNNESYLRSLQRPLHIDIPKSPDSTLNNSQKHYLHPGNASTNLPVAPTTSPSSNALRVSSSSPSLLHPSSASLSSSSSAETTIYNYAEDAPPTLLYAYNYNLPHKPNNSRQASNSPRMNYSVVVCQPENDVATTSTAASTLATPHAEKFHATFALEQRQRFNDTTTFYCAPQPSAAQGQEDRTVQHPAGMNAPSNSYPTPTSMPQTQEFRPEESRLDVNNNSSFYVSKQFHCPTFVVSQSQDRSLRKDSGCLQIPSGFYGHNNTANPDNSIKLAPAELSSNPGSQFHGNSRTCTSAHPPHPAETRRGNQSPAVQPLSSSSTKQDSDCVNPHNNGNQHAASMYSLNGQSRSDADPLAPSLHPSHSLISRDNIHRSGVPSSPYHSYNATPSLTTSQDNARPALKKHLLFGQRSEVMRRHCYSSAADDTLGHQHPQTSVASVCRRHPVYGYQYHEEQTRRMTGGEPYGPATQGNGAHAVSTSNLLSAGVSSAKRPCLQSVSDSVAVQHQTVLTSCYRGAHVTDEPLVWRPW
ncbi:transcription factor HES-1 [Elysia marginata]|uniref:Transcription factor HES-1 n=1 Tax=Elysia marginata TaxID=1093978 RepID=A0AAV4JI11_9GAST|nr:transcription factor HES-1 [Elysia marginata]